MRQRLADYVADFLVAHGVTDCFSVVGGGAMHLNDALGHKKGLKVTYNHHEQACAMAAEAYARIDNRIAELGKENQQLKQQLEEKDKEIEDLKAQRHIYLNRSVEECNKITDLEFELQHKQQDKISFAIEQLEKVKGLIANHTQELWTCENDDIDLVLYEEIDNQIKELKGEETI